MLASIADIGDVVTDRVMLSNNVFEANLATISNGLYIQGSPITTVTNNTFKHNTVPFLVHNSWINSVDTVLGEFFAPGQTWDLDFYENGVIDNFTEASPLFTKQGAYLLVDGCTFQNNSQGTKSMSGLYFGTSMTLDSMIGTDSITVKDSQFLDNTGLDKSWLENTPILTNSDASDDATAEHINRHKNMFHYGLDDAYKGSQQPLITMSIWNFMQGITHSDKTWSISDVTQCNKFWRHSNNLTKKEAQMDVLIQGSTFADNSFLFTEFNAQIMDATESEFVKNRLTSIFHFTTFEESQGSAIVTDLYTTDDNEKSPENMNLFHSATFVMRDSRFVNNHVLDGRSMFDIDYWKSFSVEGTTENTTVFENNVISNLILQVLPIELQTRSQVVPKFFKFGKQGDCPFKVQNGITMTFNNLLFTDNTGQIIILDDKLWNYQAQSCWMPQGSFAADFTNIKIINHQAENPIIQVSAITSLVLDNINLENITISDSAISLTCQSQGDKTISYDIGAITVDSGRVLNGGSGCFRLLASNIDFSSTKNTYNFNGPWICQNMIWDLTNVTNSTSVMSAGFSFSENFLVPSTLVWKVINTTVILPEDSLAGKGVFAVCVYASKPSKFDNLNCEGTQIQDPSPLKTEQPVYLVYFEDSAQYKDVDIVFSDWSVKDNQCIYPVGVSLTRALLVNSTFQNNTSSKQSSALFIQSSTDFKIKDVTFTNNAAYVGTLLTEESTLRLSNVTFSNNTAEAEAGCIKSVLADITISGCTFSGNTAAESSVIMVEFATLFSIEGNTVFENNNATTSNTINLFQSTVTIKDTTFSNNDAQSRSRNIFMLDCSATIRNVTFKQDTLTLITRQIEGGYINTVDSSLIVEQSKFIKSSAVRGAAIKYASAEELNLTISDSEFERNYARDEGGSLHISAPAQVRITDSRFLSLVTTSKHEGAYIYANEGATLKVENTAFEPSESTSEDYAGSFIRSIFTNMSFENCSLTNINPNAGASLQGMNLELVSLILNNVSMKGFTSIGTGGALNLIGADTDVETPTLQITNSIFESNAADYAGGAIYVSKAYSVDVESTQFLNNSVTERSPIKSVELDRNSTTYKRGGAIFFDSILSSSSLSIKAGTEFENNTATYGGALAYSGRQFDLDNTVYVAHTSGTSKGNTARGRHGDFIAGYLVKFQEAPLSDESLVIWKSKAEDEDYLSRLLEESGSTIETPTKFSSGDLLDPPIAFQGFDDYDQLVKSDSSTLMQVLSKTGVDCGTTLFGVYTRFRADQGLWIIYPLQLFVTPGLQSCLAFEALIEPLSNLGRENIGSAKDLNIPYTLESKYCLTGEILTDTNACMTCEEDTFVLTNTSRKCEECTKDEEDSDVTAAFCKGGDIYGPRPNYWRLSRNDAKMVTCKNTEACKGMIREEGTETENWICDEPLNSTYCYTGWCDTNYRGNLCGDCRDGFGYQNQQTLTCVPCSNNAIYYVFAVLIFIGAIIYIVFLVRSSLKDVKDDAVEQFGEEQEHLNRKSIENTKEHTGWKKSSTYDTTKDEKKVSVKEGRNVDIIDSDQDDHKSSSSKRQEPDKEKESKDQSKGASDTAKKEKTKDLSEEEEKKDSSHEKSKLDDPDIEHQLAAGENDNNAEEEDELDAAAINMKILTDYFQLVAIVSMYDFPWPNIIDNSLSATESVSQGTAEIFTLDCLLRYGVFERMGFSGFFAQLLVISLAPFAMLVVVYLIWLMIFFVKHRKRMGQYKRKFASNYVCTIVVIMYVLHPPILQLSLESFICTSLGDDENGAQYLERDLQVQCWQSEHTTYALALGLPAFLIWGLGMPIAATLFLRKNKAKLNSINMKAKYSFLYEGYVPKSYYW